MFSAVSYLERIKDDLVVMMQHKYRVVVRVGECKMSVADEAFKKSYVEILKLNGEDIYILW